MQDMGRDQKTDITKKIYEYIGLQALIFKNMPVK